MVCLKDRVIELLKQREMKQKELAERIGVTESALSRYLSEEREPDLETLSNMATVLHTTTDYLLGRENQIDISNLQRLLARNVAAMTKEQKIEIINILFSNGVQSDFPDDL